MTWNDEPNDHLTFQKEMAETDLESQYPLLSQISWHEQPQIDKKSSPKQDTKFLDGIRGLAALWVFQHHLIESTDHFHGFGADGKYSFITLPFIRIFFSGGAAAVTIFFVLSGFVLSQPALRMIRDRENRHCRQYLLASGIKRPIRLYLPCMVVGLVVALLVQMPSHVYPPWIQCQSSLFAELSNWVKATALYFNPFRDHSWSSGQYPYDTPLWTIPVELKGSMFIYGLCAILCFIPIGPGWIAFLLTGLTILLLQVGWWTGGCFSGGLLLSVYYEFDLLSTLKFSHLSTRIKTLIIHLLFVLGYYLLCQPALDGSPQVSAHAPGWVILHSLIPKGYTTDTYYRFWQSYGAMAFLQSTLYSPCLQRFFNSKALQFLGRVSFMLYVIHYPVFQCLWRLKRMLGDGAPAPPEYWFDDILHVSDLGTEGVTLRLAVKWLTYLPVTLLLASICTTYIDRSAIRMGKMCVESLGLAQR